MATRNIYVDPQSSQIYGADIELDIYGDFTVSNYNDVGVVTGSDNLVQAIKNRLATEVGDLLYAPSYGVDLYNIIGRKNIYEKVMLIKKHVQNSLMSDPRIQTIMSIDVLQDTVNPAVLYVDVVALPINAQVPISLNMVFPWVSDIPRPSNLSTISDEAQTAILKGVVKVQYKPYDCQGVWLSTDTTHAGTNYFLGGYVDLNMVYLGFELPTDSTSVLVSYLTLDTVYTALTVTQISNEALVSTSAVAIRTALPIYDISGVWLASDTTHIGLNYWTAGTGTFDGNAITLGYNLPGIEVPVVVNYSTSVRA